MKLSNRYYSVSSIHGIVVVKYRPFLHITLADARIIGEDCFRFFKNLQFPVLIKNSKIKSIDKAVRDYLFGLQYGLKNIKAIAFKVDNQVDLMILKVIFHQHTPGISHLSFSNESDALTWLNQYR